MKKKQKTESPRPPRKETFNNPFQSLKGLKTEIQEQERKNKQKAQTEENKPAIEKIKAEDESDEELFENAMGGITPLAGKDKKMIKSPDTDYIPGARRAEEDAEVMRELDAMVKGTSEFDISPSDEFIEIRSRDLDLETLKKLRQGEFSRQAWLDLHRKTREEARELIERFVFEAQVKGFRCVGIIPGRGLHSEGGVAILKPTLVMWLRRGKFKKMILAIVSAIPGDGGLGAIYVLLRKRVFRSG